MATQPADGKRVHLRHTVATLAYRGGKVLRDAPASFGTFTIGETSRTPSQILAHIDDLLDWTLKGENYFRADIVAGRVGGTQSPPRREFD